MSRLVTKQKMSRGKEINTTMAQMLELADEDFITNVIKMFKDIKKKMVLAMES